jgi:hypothetical protein
MLLGFFYVLFLLLEPTFSFSFLKLSMAPGDAEEWSVFEITPQAAESAMGKAAAAAPASG